MNDVMGKMTISNGEINYPSEMKGEPQQQPLDVVQPTLAPEAPSEPATPAAQQPATQQPAQPEAPRPNGYMTRDEYIKRKGTDIGFKSPEEFTKALDEAPWMRKERIEKLEMENRELKQDLSGVKTLIDKQFEAGKKAALDEINKKQFDAIQQGDQITWTQLENEKNELKQVQSAIPQPTQPQSQEVPPELVHWQKQNPWFGRNGDYQMTQDALMISDQLTKDHPFAPPAQIAAQVEREIKQKYAAKFGLPTGQQNGFMAKGQGAVQQTQKVYTMADLTPEDRNLASKWRKYGYKSQDEYVKDIIKTY